jgi:nucleotide-binding universal stress UspA family protein
MEDKIITIASYPYARAQLLKGRLEAEGIECFLSNINLVQPHVSSGVKIKINEKDAEAATKIIEDIKEEYGEAKQKTVDRLKSIRKILVPVDFTAHAINACDFALGLGTKLNAEIMLVYSYFNPILTADANMDDGSYYFHLEEVIGNIEKEAVAKMENLVKILKEKGKSGNSRRLKISYELAKGTPEDVILDLCESYKPAVIVIGSRGREEGFLNFPGSVTRTIIKKAKIPVLVIPHKSAFLGMNYVSKVLYATDFDEADFKSLRTLLTLMRPFDIRIYCVHIARDLANAFDKAKMDDLKLHLEEEYSEFQVTCDVMEHHDVIEGLEDYIGKQDIDLIALTTHKKGIIERLFNPDIAKKMLYQTNIPLLIFQS